MNLDRYEKIDGREALRRLADGETIYASYGTRYEIVHKPVFDEVGLYYTTKDGGNAKSRIEVSVVLSNKWYIPKPFDVRQALIDRPNEWVGAIEHGGYWFKVGFDLKRMAVVSTIFKNDVPVLGHHPVVSDTFALRLDDCIPIEDAPEEANQ